MWQAILRAYAIGFVGGDVQTSKQHMFGRAQTGSQGSAASIEILKLLNK